MTEPKPDPAATPDGPAFGFLWALGLYVIFALALGYPALSGQFLVSPVSDQYIGGYPVRQFATLALQAGQGIPQWNPYLFGGLPYIAAMHGDIFYPTFLLRMVLPTDVAMTWGFIIHLVLAGAFTYGFLRAWGTGFYPALLGGTAYMLSGQIASLVSPGHDGKLYVSALFALTLWLLVRAIRDGRLWAYGALALTVGLGVLSPHPQLLQYSLLGSGAFGLFLALARHKGLVLPRRAALGRLAGALGAVVVGLFIGAVQYVPVLAYVDWSPRAGGRDYAYATSFSMPIEELFNTYLPQFTGILDHYWGRNGIHFHSEYLGAVALLLAGAALIRPVRGAFTWFWVGTLVVAVLWALGGNTPFYHLVYAIVPGSKFFRAPSTIFFLVSFSIAILAALGLERALEGLVGRRYLWGGLIAGAVIAVLASVGGLTELARAIASPGAQSGVVANGPSLLVGAWRSLGFLAVAAGLLLAHSYGRIGPRPLAALLVLVMAADLISVASTYWRFSPPAAITYAADPAIEYIKAQPAPGRVIPWPLSPEMASHDPFLNGDALMAHQIRLTLGYHGNELRRYQQLVGKDRGYASLFENPNVLALTNSRYLYTNAPVPSLTKLVGPVQNAAGTTVYLYQLPGENPAAWVTPMSVKAGDDVALATLLDPRFDLRRAAIFDSAALIPSARTDVQGLRLPDTLPLGVQIPNYEAGHIVVEITGDVPAGAALVVSENYYPGWRATVDGAAANSARADYGLIGVELPAGARRVELTFQDSAYARGKVITFVSLIAAGAATLLGLLLPVRRRA